MTFPDILLLDDDALNLAVERHCYPTSAWIHRHPFAHGAGAFILIHADVEGGIALPRPHLGYTTSWRKCMALAWRYGIDVLAPDASGEAWVRIPAGAVPALRCATEEEVRRGICRLALWRAIQEQLQE